MNFLATEFARQANLTTIPIKAPLANTLNGDLLAQVTHQTVPIPLLLVSYHCENLVLYHALSSCTSGPRAPLASEA